MSESRPKYYQCAAISSVVRQTATRWDILTVKKRHPPAVNLFSYVRNETYRATQVS